MVTHQHMVERRTPDQMPDDYEIRLHHSDGTLSVVRIVSAVSDADARAQAGKLLEEGLANAHIFRDGRLVDSIYRIKG